MTHEHKAVTIQGIVEVIKKLGWYDAVRARVEDDVKAVLDDPNTSRYHPGAMFDRTMTAVFELHGPQGAEQVMHGATEGSLRGVIGPLAKMFMTLSGGGPLPLLERFETLISGGGRGFEAKWSPSEPKAGELIITTETATPPASDFAWKGTLTYLLTFAGVTGKVEIMPRQHKGRSVRLMIRWS
jgi:hypothetical protein